METNLAGTIVFEKNIPDYLGQTNTIIAAAGLLVIIALIVIGIVLRLRGKDWYRVSWWLRNLSRLFAVYGVAAFAGYLCDFYDKLGIVGIGDPGRMNDVCADAFARLFVPAVLSVAACLALLVVRSSATPMSICCRGIRARLLL